MPIPTYYGDEICRVNGMRYAFDVVVDTTRYRLQRVGFGSGSYRDPDKTYEFKTSPHSSHGRIAAMVGDRTDRPLLDVGCGSGELAAVLRAAGHTVLGVDQREPDSVAMRMDRFMAADLGDGLPDEVGGGFGTVIAADVVEHLADPTLLMQDLAAAADPDGSVIISVPNFGHWYPRLRVALGRWDYDERGILDRTHLRFFNRRTFLRAAADAGLTPRRSSNTGLPFDALRLDERSLVLRPIAAVDRLLARVWPNLFAYQLIYEFRTSVPDELRRKGERGFSS